MSLEYKNTTARASATLRSTLRKDIFSGTLKIGSLLPSVRALSKTFQLTPKTVHYALQALEREGLIGAEPRKGFRILSRSKDPRQGFPVASILDTNHLNNTSPLHQTLNTLIEKTLAEQAIPILNIFTETKSITEIVSQIKKEKTWGVLLDTVNLPLLIQMEKIGIPAVMIDAWVENAPFDVVLQDNYQGGYEAAKYLIKQGHKRIAWLGPIGSSGISRERFAGALVACETNGASIPNEWRFECEVNKPHAKTLELLSIKNRPDAILSLWSEISISVASNAKKLKLKIGKDFEMVGWTTEDKYEKYALAFEKNNTPPTIIWDPQEMAQMAINRLSEKWQNPTIPTMRILVPTYLRV